MNPSIDLATVEAAFFEKLVGRSFMALPTDTPDAPALTLELLQVQELHHRASSTGRAPFSLLFKSSDPARMQQGTYTCEGPSLAGEPIFLVPVRDVSRGLCLEAVFN